MELASPLTFLYSFLVPSPLDDNDEFSIPSYNTTQKILASLFLIHYFNRVFIYTYRAPNVASIHLIILLSAIIFNVINGYSNGRWISVFGNYTEERYKEPLFILGVLIFFIGMWINIEHDNILFNLRKENSSKTSSNEKSIIVDDLGSKRKKYYIPNGGLFNYVCCPNYLGEIIEWIGFAIACWYSLPAILFAIMTPANLFPRAKNTFKWYKVTFKEYPKDRKVIIPFIW
ncbi:849_t:CDS:1 [Funneliformis geosporum]|uniref:18430_t:CDS:1 n=1 Tax=Funneliformis geosporum TaxID=1117311 RepID=A0A9W4SRP9_9GLOM|nr:18430_t:CDS:1 [Funneliformis geosporum]CAI2185380.1 849_t:CDS:1 [Funneliformis geosporum]